MLEKNPTTPTSSMSSDDPGARAPERATMDYLKQRIMDLAVSGALAARGVAEAAATAPSIADGIALALVALDVAHNEVIDSDADVRRVDNTRRALIDVVQGCPLAFEHLSKRDALFTVGVLLDAGLVDAFTDLASSGMLAELRGVVARMGLIA